MRFKNAFLTLMAFITALGSSVGASAEAFTIPAGATTYCKKNVSPVKDWWPNNGNTSGNDSYGAAGLAVVNDKLWVLTMNGNYNDLSTYKLNILNSTTFAKEGEASLSGVDNTTGNQLFPLYDLTRMGNAVISINRPYHRYINLKIYCWESTGAPTLLFDAPLSNYLADSSTNGCNPYQGLGAIGTPGDGKIYIAAIRGETINRVIVFTIKNKKTTAVQEVTLSQDFPGKNINIEPMEDGSFWVTNFADTYGIHYNANGNKIEELSGNGIGTIYGTGQRFFTFKGRKLALNMNCSNGSTAPKLSLIDYTAGVANGKNIITDAQPTLSSNDLTPMGFTFCDYDIKSADRHLVLYGVDPDGGIVRVEYKDDRRPATVTGFSATAREEGTSQKVDLKWNAADKAT